jgi:hypothetical protein
VAGHQPLAPRPPGRAHHRAHRRAARRGQPDRRGGAARDARGRRPLGAGYGHVTAAGEAAAARLADAGLPAVDGVYAAKAAAALFAPGARPGPTLLWLTKSSTALAAATDAQVAAAPSALRRWLGR